MKIRTKKGIKFGYCKLKDKEVSIFCNQCPINIRYGYIQSPKKAVNKKPIQKRSSKLAKAEKERFSIIYQDLTKCCVKGCLTPYYKVQKNEVYEGAYRQLSIKHGMVCPFCENHHNMFHNDREFALYYKRLFQDRFVEEYGIEEFMKIFKINYHFRK